MADKRKIIYFLEDAAQEAFIPPLVERIIIEEGKSLKDFEIDVLCSSGGGSIKAYKKYLKDTRKNPSLHADVLIVGSDGNCKGFNERRKQLEKVAEHAKYPCIITAIPDPHIERWYLLDSSALSSAVGERIDAAPPTVKCDKNRYKTLLSNAINAVGISPPLGGVEYGPVIASLIDLYAAGRKDHAFRDFEDKIRSWIKRQG